MSRIRPFLSIPVFGGFAGESQFRIEFSTLSGCKHTLRSVHSFAVAGMGVFSLGSFNFP
jgi:hypothetical protein